MRWPWHQRETLARGAQRCVGVAKYLHKRPEVGRMQMPGDEAQHLQRIHRAPDHSDGRLHHLVVLRAHASGVLYVEGYSPPLEGGGWGRGPRYDQPLPANPLPQGEGEPLMHDTLRIFIQGGSADSRWPTRTNTAPT